MLGWELPPHNSGGLGVACYQLCKALSNKGADIEFILPYTARHDVDFMRISAAHPQDVRAVMRAGIAYDSVKYVKQSGQIEYVDLLGQCAMYEQAVERIVNLGEYDIIHAHDWLTCRAAVRAKMLTGLPLIIHMHSTESDRSGRPMGGNSLVRGIEQTALSLADRIVAVSHHTKRTIMREYGIPADNIAVVHNHIEPEDLIPQSAGAGNDYAYLEYLRSRGWHVVSNVGRLTIQKGLPNLLRAFQLVTQRLPKTMLLIAGAGEQYHELVRMSADLGIARNVVFAGFQRGKRYRDTFTVADLFVMPSISEPFGFAALETVGYGTPLLISRQSGASEVINNCLKVDFWDIHEMANKIVGALESQALRDELSANATKEYLRLSWDKSVDTLLNMYHGHTAGPAND